MKGDLFRRLTAGALALFMVGASVPSDSNFSQLFTGSEIVASAAESSGKCGENATYKYDSTTNTLTVSGTGEMYDYDPGVGYEDSAPWAEYYDEIENLIISEGITSIGENAFNGYSRLTEVTIPASVKTIGASAFESCTSLSQLNFAEGSKLTTIDYQAFFNTKILTLDFPVGLKRIGQSAFENCKVLRTVVFPSTVDTIAPYAFYTDSVKSYFFHASDTSSLYIGEHALHYVNNIVTVPMGTLEQYREKLGDKYYISDNLVMFGNDVWCELAQINPGESTPYYRLTLKGQGDMWDYGNGKWFPLPDLTGMIKEAVITKGITRIGDAAFSWGCQGIDSICLIDSVTFEEGSKLESIGENAFLQSRINEMILPEGLKEIGERAFEDCPSLSHVVIPSTVTTIGDHAFRLCQGINTIDCNVDDPTKLEWAKNETSYNDSFKPNKGTLCYVPRGTLDAYKTKFGDVNITFVSGPYNIVVDKNIKNGKVTVDKTTAMANETVQITATPAAHCKFKSLTVKDAGGKTVSVTDSKFTMPDDDVTVTATFEKVKYTVKFVNEDGTVLQSTKVAYGTVPQYTGETPTKAKTAQYTYTFKGWDKTPVAVTGTATYKATYKSAVNKYTIKFVNEDGTVLQSSKVAYGTVPQYTGETPTKAKTAQYTYTFKGWDKTPVAVTGTATYKATYKSAVNKYTIKFVNEDGTVLQSSKVAYGTVPQYTGETPTKAKTAQYTYTFKGWDKTPVAVTGTATYKATYTSAVNKYTIKFVNEDGTVLQSTKVAYGTVPQYTGETPTKAKTAQYTYTFKGWDKTPVAVTGTATYKATYKSAKVRFSVTAEKCENGSVSADKTSAAWGSTVTVTPAPYHGYVVKAVYLDGEQMAVNDKGKYQFEMPQKDVVVSAEFEKQPCTVVRAAGSNRFATAAEISNLTFDKTDTVIIAYGDKYADALAGIPLAAKLNAPVLLTQTNYVPADTLAEIERLGAKKAVLLGGEGAIGKQCEETLKNAGLTTERIAGRTRFGTAAAIAEMVNDSPEEIFFVYGLDYADALSVNPVAAIKQAPIIYLRKSGEIDDDTAAYLAKIKGKVKNAYIIGGSGVISDDMMNKAVQAVAAKNAFRISGKNRYLTCIAVNEQFRDTLTGDMICAATANNFPDALAGGLFAARNKAPLILVNTKSAEPSFSDEQANYLKAKVMDTIVVFGGKSAVPEAHVKALAEAAGCRLIEKN